MLTRIMFRVGTLLSFLALAWSTSGLNAQALTGGQTDPERIAAGAPLVGDWRLGPAVSPSTKHEKCKSLIVVLVLSVCDELEMDVVSFGSFPMKSDLLRKGAEADDCFYIQHAAALQGKDDVKLGFDPPPDLVIEIDLTHDSRDKLEIYAALGVPEIWRYDGSRLSVLKLVDETYTDVEFSLCFPILSADWLTELIAILRPGTNRARRELRSWVRANKPPALTSE